MIVKFSSVHEAFKWFLEHTYKNLPADQKKGRLTYAWRDYTHHGSITEKRMRDILAEFGEIRVITEVYYKPD